MVDFAQLTKMNTSKLTSAAAASGKFATAMTTRGEEVRTSSVIPAGMWTGADANAASTLLAGMPEPLYNLSDSANRGKKTLDDLATEIGRAKERLQDAHDAIAGTGITIGADGTVTTPVVNDPNVAAENDRKAQSARDIIADALNIANDADTAAAKDLNSQAGTVQASYMEIPGKQDDLTKATDLLNTPKDEITPQKAQELNDLLKRNNNPEFNKQLMQKLGPEALIEDSARFSATGSKLAESGDAAGAEAFKETQRLLGESLASASQNGGLKENDFTQKLMDQAAKPLADDPLHNGYRALAPLLEHGQYDKSFLVPVAEHMTRLDAITPGVGLQNPYNPGSLPSLDNPYVIDGNSSGPSNPLNSAMGALDRNPAAAADYFNGDNSEHGMYKNANGAEVPAIKGDSANPNIDYALDHARKPDDGYTLDVNRVGNALEAAATGVPGGTPADVPRPAHTEEMANVAEGIVDYFGPEHKDALSEGKPLADLAPNITDVAANYMPDIQNSMLHPNDQAAFSIDVKGVEADLNETNAKFMLQTLGQNQDSVATLMGANDAARTAMVTEALQQNGAQGEWVQRATEPGSAVNAILADAVADGVQQSHQDTVDAHNKGIELATTGAGIVAGLIPNPLVGGIVDSGVGALGESLQSQENMRGLFEATATDGQFNDANRTAAETSLRAALGADGVVTPEEEKFIQNNIDDINNGRTVAKDESHRLLHPEGGGN